MKFVFRSDITIKLNEKTVVITGCDTGIGYEIALDFANRGARVLMACRDQEQAEKAKEGILKKVPEANLEIKKLDLSSLDSVRECASAINKTESRIDILVNNADTEVTWYASNAGNEKSGSKDKLSLMSYDSQFAGSHNQQPFAYAALLAIYSSIVPELAEVSGKYYSDNAKDAPNKENMQTLWDLMKSKTSENN